MKRVAELEGVELALWAAKASGMKFVMRGEWPAEEFDFDPERHATEHILGSVMKQYVYFLPHKDWAQGGPLLEEYAIGFHPISDAEWQAEEHITCCTGRGPTPLIAAMRALVASKFGETVDEVAK